jgi:hypothetical protein
MIPCPLCNQRVSVLPLDRLIETRRLRPMEECILRAVWEGKGRPVQSERIFDVLYADDPNGGPAPSKMYAAFYSALSSLRARLDASGVTIDSAGLRRGYRLSLKGAQ